MSRPDEKQLDIALAEAERMRDQNEDPQYLARSLLYLARRDNVLERLQSAVEHYLNSGHGQMEHSRLIKALDEARHQLWEEAHNGSSNFGLE